MSFKMGQMIQYSDQRSLPCGYRGFKGGKGIISSVKYKQGEIQHLMVYKDCDAEDIRCLLVENVIAVLSEPQPSEGLILNGEWLVQTKTSNAHPTYSNAYSIGTGGSQYQFPQVTKPGDVPREIELLFTDAKYWQPGFVWYSHLGEVWVEKQSSQFTERYSSPMMSYTSVTTTFRLTFYKNPFYTEDSEKENIKWNKKPIGFLSKSA